MGPLSKAPTPRKGTGGSADILRQFHFPHSICHSPAPFAARFRRRRMTNGMWKMEKDKRYETPCRTQKVGADVIAQESAAQKSLHVVRAPRADHHDTAQGQGIAPLCGESCHSRAPGAGRS